MRFTKDHEWIDLQGDVAAVGVTAYAARKLGDVVFVDLSAVGQALKAGDAMALVQGVNVTSNLPAPVDGAVTEANAALLDTPEAVNQDPEKTAWLVKLKVADSAQVEALMDRPAYEDFLDSL